jgi:hypothetical protein
MEQKSICTGEQKPIDVYLSHVERGLFSRLKEPPALEILADLHSSERFWLALTKRLTIIDIFILQILYVPTTTATYLQDVVNQISKYNLQRTAVRNRLNKLEALGLIKMTRSSLTCVNSIPALEGRVKRLIMCCKLKFEW